MADTGFSRSPLLVKGALVQLVRDIVGVIPHIVVFQYNPEKLTHAITPWNPFEGEATAKGTNAPSVQPFEPKETFTLSIELDATDGMEDGNPLAATTGVAAQLAALKKLIVATEGPLGDVIRSAKALARKTDRQEIERPTVPIVLFVWGPGRILPVRITSFSVDETLFSPQLYPLQATVALGLEVLTPDVFKCQDDLTVKIAIAAYNATRLQEDALAVANVFNTAAQLRAMLPF